MRRALPRATLAGGLLLAGALALVATTRADAQSVPASVGQLHDLFGEDPRADHGRLRIPAIGLDAPVSAHDVDADDPILPSPYGPGDIAWYDFEVGAFGGDVGSGRNAVYSAHVDYNATVPHAGIRYRGPGAFADLDDLSPGDIVEVRRGGTTHRYAVSWTRVIAATDLETWGAMIRADTPIESVTLYTCDGIFHAGTISYSHRLVVRAELLAGTPRRFAAPAGGRFSVGVSGTTHPVALAEAQRWPVEAVYALDEASGEWLVYRPGAPQFVNTLFGHLRRDSFVIIAFK